jgi:hypothetical protein
MTAGPESLPLAGPGDEQDEEANGDPDSTLGDEDEMGFNEMVWWPDPLFAEDGGFEGPEDEDFWDEEDEDEDGEEDEC